MGTVVKNILGFTIPPPPPCEIGLIEIRLKHLKSLLNLEYFGKKERKKERKKASKKRKVSSNQLRKSKKRKINGIYCPLNEWIFIHLILFLSYSLAIMEQQC